MTTIPWAKLRPRLKKLHYSGSATQTKPLFSGDAATKLRVSSSRHFTTTPNLASTGAINKTLTAPPPSNDLRRWAVVPRPDGKPCLKMSRMPLPALASTASVRSHTDKTRHRARCSPHALPSKLLTSVRFQSGPGYHWNSLRPAQCCAPLLTYMSGCSGAPLDLRRKTSDGSTTGHYFEGCRLSGPRMLPNGLTEHS